MKSHAKNITLIILVVFLSHGLLLANNGLYWDDSTVWKLFEEGESALRHYFNELGINLASYFFFMVNSVNKSLLSYKLATFLTLLAIPLIVYSLALQSGALSALQSLMISLLFAASPANQSLPASMAIWTYSFSYFLFFSAALLTVWIPFKNLFSLKKNFIFFIPRALTLGLFFVSFTMMSLLVFYFGFLTYWFFKEEAKQNNRETDFSFRRLVAFARGRMDYILLPFIFWVIKILFFEPHGNFEGQNAFHWDPLSIFKNLAIFIYYPFLQLINAVPENVLTYPLAVLFFFFLIHGYTNKGNNQRNSSITPKTKGVVLFGIYLLILSVLPYVLVGKSPGVYGETITRHAWLTPLPMAILIVAIMGLKKISQKEMLQRMLITAFLSSFVITSVGNYTMWQKRWIKFESIAGHLSSSPLEEGSLTYVIEDNYPMGSRYNNINEWEWLFVRLWGKKERQILYGKDASNQDLSNQNGLPGDKTFISVSRGTFDGGENYSLMKYYCFRLIGNDTGLKSLLNSFVNVTVKNKG